MAIKVALDLRYCSTKCAELEEGIEVGNAIRTLADIECAVVAHLAAQGVQVERTELIGNHRLRVVNDVADIRVVGPGSVPASMDIEAVSRHGTRPAALFAVEFPHAVDLEACDAGVVLYSVDRDDGTVSPFDQTARIREAVASSTASTDALARLVDALGDGFEGFNLDSDGNLTRDSILALASRDRPRLSVTIGGGPIERTYTFAPGTKSSNVIVTGDGAVAWQDGGGFTCLNLASGTTFKDMGDPATIENGVLVSGYGLLMGAGYGWAAGYRTDSGEQLWKNPTDPLLAGSWRSAVATAGVAAVPLARLPSADRFAIAGFELESGEPLWRLDIDQPAMVTARHGCVTLGEVLDGRFGLRIFDARTGEQRGDWKPEALPRTVRSDPDADLLWLIAAAPNSDGTYTVWWIDGRGGTLLDTLRLPGTEWSCDAGYIYWQEREQVLRRRPGAEVEVLARGYHLAYSRKGYTVGTSSYGLAAWNSATGVRTMEAPLEQLFPDGWAGRLHIDLIEIDGTDLILAQDGVLAVVDLRDGTIRQHESLEPMGKIDGVTEAEGHRWIILSDGHRGAVVPIVASVGHELDDVLGLLDGVTASLLGARPRPELGGGDRG